MKSKRTSSALRKAIKLAGVGALAIFIATLLEITIYKFVPVTDTVYMRVMASKHAVDVTQQWVPIEKISPELALAVISSEDNRFTKHNGFEIKGLERAWESVTGKGKRIVGGSTISQQTAKNVFLNNSRTYLRKGVEAIITIMIEAIWGKERIMEVYLNVIEQGPGIYGAEASAQKFFRHSAARITRQEAALMAAVLPAPAKRNIGRPTPYLRKRQNQIATLMRKIGKVDYDARSKNEE